MCLQASLLIEAGRPIPEIAARLGHKSPAVTMQVYAHWLRDDDSASAEAIPEFTRRTGAQATIRMIPFVVLAGAAAVAAFMLVQQVKQTSLQTEAIEAQTQAIEDSSTDARWMAMLNRLAICDNTVAQAMKDNSSANHDAFRDRPYCVDGVAAAAEAEKADVDELVRYGLDFSQDEPESEG